MRKVYVPVTVRFDTEGKPRPLEIEFDPAHRYAMDKILDVRRPPVKAWVVWVIATPAGFEAVSAICGWRREDALWRQKVEKSIIPSKPTS